MQILVAAATELEIKPFKTQYPSADILITGVGSPATIYHLTKRVQAIDYDLVIQAGIAGVFGNDHRLGDVVTVQSDQFADLGVLTATGFESIFDMKLADPEIMPYQKGWLNNPESYSLPYGKVKGITVNTITDDPAIIQMFSAKFCADIETMEGAAVHYVCLQENVPFLQLRSLSNHIGERDKTKWMLELAIHNLNHELESIYKNMKSERLHKNTGQ